MTLLDKVIEGIANGLVATWQRIKENQEALQVLLTFGAIVLAYCLLKETAKQVEVTQELGHKQLRPYIAVIIETDSLERNSTDQVLIPDTEQYILRNVGQTPAYNVRCVTDYYALERIEYDPIVLDSSKAHLVPMLTDEILTSVRRAREGRRPRIVFVGKITYDDTFGAHHMTTFSYVYYNSQNRFFADPEDYNREYY